MKTLLFAGGLICLAMTASLAEPPAGAGGDDWPRFLGPAHNATSRETKLLKTWGKDEPKLLWEFAKGTGHASPAVSGKSLVLFHRVGTRETVDCLEAETGKALWKFDYEAPYRDRYGSGDGPKTNAVIAEGRVFVFGISGQLHCLELANGNVLWKRDPGAEYRMKPNFFGHGSTPLVLGNRLIVQLGGEGDACVVAFDTATGKPLWTATHPWGSSYASPVPATLHGRECVLVFAGGESRPPTGGLLCIDAKTGQVLNATPHRSTIAESVNASSPVVVGNRVFVTEAYGAGGAMIEIAPDFSAKPLWKADDFSAYFMTPVARDGYLYGCSGQQPRLAELVCYEAATGREMWRDDLGGKFQRASLLAVDGAFLCLGENGLLAWLDLSPKGAAVIASKPLFSAPESWTLPALSRGLLYISQNGRDAAGKGPRLRCYDLRGQSVF
ncbi:MAG: PQQ-binding-like beta-propeller repeat protein [Verrucomicrobiota bacterium]